MTSLPRGRLVAGHSTVASKGTDVSRAAADGPAARSPRSDNRLSKILDAAAAQFASHGFQGASIRDIVKAVGMLPGSLYYHFRNKDELLAAVHAEGVRCISESVRSAVQRRRDPWARLEAACAAHIEALVDRSAYAKVVISVDPGGAPAVRDTLIRQRDEYEQLFIELLDALPLPARSDRRMLRMLLLGALNWTPTWYRPGRSTPKRIARAFIRQLRHAPTADVGALRSAPTNEPPQPYAGVAEAGCAGQR